MKTYLLILSVFCCYKVCFGQLRLGGVKCGSRICAGYEYCSQFHNSCEQCSKICNPNDGNVEVAICERDCQDYLLDARYGKLGGKGSVVPVSNENLKGDVQKLNSLVIVSLTLTCLTILVLSVILIMKFYKYVKKNDITLDNIKNYFTNSDDSINKAPNGSVAVTVASGKPDLRLNMPSAESQTGLHTPATMTTSISRRPAEDSTLDYAYDNPALSTGTPSPHGGKPAPRGSHF